MLPLLPRPRFGRHRPLRATSAARQNAAEKTNDRNRNKSPDRKFYDTAAWAQCSKNIRVYYRFSAPRWMNTANSARGVLCSFITSPTRAMHRRGRLDWSNLVALCEENATLVVNAVQPGAKDTSTHLARLSSVYKHIGHDGGFPQWKKQPTETAAETSTQKPATFPHPCGGRVFLSVSDDELDAALAAERLTLNSYRTDWQRENHHRTANP